MLKNRYTSLFILLLVGVLSGCGSASSQDKQTVKVSLRDDIQLTTDLWFPDGEGTWPAILIRTPYGKHNQAGYGKFFSKHGYVVAIQEVRGTGSSDGQFDLWINEKEDGYDAVEWLASQEWCSGKVGMVGGSYNGYTQLAAAATKPPHLVTIVPLVTMGDPSIHHVYPGGMFHTSQHLQALSIFKKYETGESGAYALPSGWKNQLDTLPVIALDESLLGQSDPQWRSHLEHKPGDPYWHQADVLKELETVDIPVFIIGGWYDFGGIGTKETYMHLARPGGPPVKLLIGPWSHYNLGKTKLGEHDFGEAARKNLRAMELQWFDQWLKGEENRILEEPLVELFAVGPNSWITGAGYPLPGSDTLMLFLAEGSSEKSGTLEESTSFNGREYSTYTYDPADPTPSIWFNNFPEWEKILTSREDLLIFESAPFDKEITFLGPVSATIYASSSARDTDWIVYYFLIDDEGNAFPPPGRGVMRSGYRDPEKGLQLLDKDYVYPFHFDLWHTSFSLGPGWKIRVVICSAAAPDFSRNLNRGGNNETETEFIVASQKIYHDREHPSSIQFHIIAEDKITKYQ